MALRTPLSTYKPIIDSEKLEKMIRKATISDAAQIVSIYNYYVENSVVTFDKNIFSTQDFEKRITTISKNFPFIVYEENNQILGYAYAHKWRKKPAYSNTVESTIYLKIDCQAKGIGTILYSELLAKLKSQKFHTAIGGITLPNDASVRLHEKLGFQKAAHFKEVGKKFKQWLDVGFWQLNFDQAS